MQGNSLNRLFVLVRNFSVRTQDWQPAIRYFTKPDERHDLTAVSKAVYGTRDEALVVQAAAGLDHPELPLTERLLVLPTEAQLRELKLQAGFDDDEI